jgi:sulfate adenylyltransferase subunit 1
LYDSKSILQDQLAAIQRQTKNRAAGEVDLALLTDGLRAEREQGITIDVAYKYFSTPQRKFIIADAPGHIQYTRNMVTGASNAELIIILIDARHGVVEQTRRHSLIASLLNIRHVVVAINKMDLVDYSEDVFHNIVIDYAEVAKRLNLPAVTYIPMAALTGDNVVEASVQMPWYTGLPLLRFLETVPVDDHINLAVGRFPVQYVIRPQAEALHDYRGYAGKIVSGIYRVGDRVTVYPSGLSSRITRIERNGTDVEEAFAPQSVILHIADDVDISRGDLIVPEQDVQPIVGKSIQASVCWMAQRPLQARQTYWLQVNSRLVRVMIQSIAYRLDVHQLEQDTGVDSLQMNEVGLIHLKASSEFPFDSFDLLPEFGGGILIDETSHVTVGAVMLRIAL